MGDLVALSGYNRRGSEKRKVRVRNRVEWEEFAVANWAFDDSVTLVGRGMNERMNKCFELCYSVENLTAAENGSRSRLKNGFTDGNAHEEENIENMSSSDCRHFLRWRT